MEGSPEALLMIYSFFLSELLLSFPRHARISHLITIWPTFPSSTQAGTGS